MVIQLLKLDMEIKSTLDLMNIMLTKKDRLYLVRIVTIIDHQI